MYYYFFISETHDSKLRLVPMPGQKFPDGTPIDVHCFVRSPKEVGTFSGGCRNEYPEGTIFCSDHLEPVNTKDGRACKMFYSVFDESTDIFSADVNFHPVNTGSSFRYVKPEHADLNMNEAYIRFLAYGEQEFGDPATTTETAQQGTNIVILPYDEHGTARPEIPNWKEAYEGQLETDKELFLVWIRNVMAENGIRVRMLLNNYEKTFTKLHAMGETIDTIANTDRLKNLMNKNSLSFKDLGALGKPHEWYLKTLLNEHIKAQPTSAIKRDAANPAQVEDASKLICKAIDNLTNNVSAVTRNDINNIKEAIEKGWTLDAILNPNTLGQASNWPDLTEKLAKGTIPLIVKKEIASNVTPLALQKMDEINKCPDINDGFYINEDTWDMILCNYYTRQNTLLVGPSGSGKTEVIIRMCQKLGIEYTLISMGGVTDVYNHLVLNKDLQNNGTEIVDNWAPFALAIQKPGVIILDEINRVARNADNALFNCLDNNRVLSAPDAKDPNMRQIKVHPDCVFFATANIGFEFTGTKEIDEALDSRFDRIEMDYMPEKIEAKVLMARYGIDKTDAINIANVAAQMRAIAAKGGEVSHTVSTRETLNCARLVSYGFSCIKAMEHAFLTHFDKGSGEGDSVSERAVMANIISTRFNNKKA